MQVLTFADMEGGETFDASLLGNAEEVVEERVSDDDVILIKGAKSSRAVSCYSLVGHIRIFSNSLIFFLLIITANILLNKPMWLVPLEAVPC